MTARSKTPTRRKPYSERKADLIADQAARVANVANNPSAKLQSIVPVRKRKQVRPGKPRMYEPHELLQEVYDYVQWAHEHPLHEGKAQFDAKSGDFAEHEMRKMRRVSVMGFRVWLQIPRSVWHDLTKHIEYHDVLELIEDTLGNSSIEGAAAGLLNATIIAKELGLADRQELSGPDGGPVEVADVSDLELAKYIALTLSKATKE